MAGAGSINDIMGTAGEWLKQDLTTINPLDHLKNLGKKTEDIKKVFATPTKVDGAAGAVSQVAQLERNIEGGANAGAMDAQTKDDIYNELRGGANSTSASYETQATRIGGIQSRLDDIAGGKDTTVNDRMRLNNALLNLKDRPGRGGLLTGG